MIFEMANSKMANLQSQIAAKIAKLMLQQRTIERKRSAVLNGIIEKMTKNAITLDELRKAIGRRDKGGTVKKSDATDSSSKTRKAVAVKYKDDLGHTWSGRGRTPRWLVAAENSGRARDFFLV